MKLLIITTARLFSSATTPSVGGCFFVRFVEEMMGCGLKPTVVTPRPLFGELFQILKETPEYILPDHSRWNGTDIYRPTYFSLALTKRMRFQARNFRWAAVSFCKKLHRQDPFHLVVGYGFDVAAHTAAAVARTLGLRSVAWAIGNDVHTTPNLSRQNASLLQENVAATDLVLTESADLRRLLLERCPSAPNVHTYYKGISLEEMRKPVDRAALRTKLGLAPDKTYMLSAGHLGTAKGVWEFYGAFKALAASHPRLCAIWVGGGPEFKGLQQRATEDQLFERFSITGFRPRPTVLQYMQAADLMAFPSHAEGLPNVVMEALAAGLPVVATDVGGTREVVATGHTGILVPPKDANSLAKAVEQMLQDPTSARQMGQRGRQLIHTHFDVQRNAPVALEILRHIADGGDAKQPVSPCADTAPGHLPVEDIGKAYASVPYHI